MKDIIFWGSIIKEFGFVSPMTEKTDKLADFFIPMEKDALLIEQRALEENLSIPQELHITDMHEPQNKEAISKVRQIWKDYYKSNISDVSKQLDLSEAYVKINNLVIDADGVVPYKCVANCRIHKIIILDNIDEATKQYYITGYGGLLFNNSIKEDENGVVRFDLAGKTKAPVRDDGVSDIALFAFGGLGENTHVFTRQQFEYLSMYFSTLQSMVDYLNWKENFIKENQVLYTDDYTLAITYLERGWGSVIQQKNKQKVFITPMDDAGILKFQESDFGLKFLLATKNIGALLHYLEESTGKSVGTEGLKDNIRRLYLLMKLDQQLAMSEQLPDLVAVDYSEIPSKTFITYGNRCLYVFHTADKQIASENVRTAYGLQLTGSFALEYIKDADVRHKLDIVNIVTCVIYKDEEKNLHTTFVAINVQDVGSNPSNINVLEGVVKTGRDLGWISEELTLKNLVSKMDDKVKEIADFEAKLKNIGRNDPCPCGSGQKYKRCCGKNS